MDGLEKKNVEDVFKWLAGLVFSAGIATLQNWRNKREQAKVFRTQINEMHQVIKAPAAIAGGPAAPVAIPETEVEDSGSNPSVVTPPAEDLRSIVQRIQQQLTDHQSRGDERHEANLARFESIENQQHRVSDELSDLRKDVRQSGGSARAMMRKILIKVDGLSKDSVATAAPEETRE